MRPLELVRAIDRSAARATMTCMADPATMFCAVRVGMMCCMAVAAMICSAAAMGSLPSTAVPGKTLSTIGSHRWNGTSTIGQNVRGIAFEQGLDLFDLSFAADTGIQPLVFGVAARGRFGFSRVSIHIRRSRFTATITPSRIWSSSLTTGIWPRRATRRMISYCEDGRRGRGVHCTDCAETGQGWRKVGERSLSGHGVRVSSCGVPPCGCR